MSRSQCCENPPLLNPSCGDGSVEQLGCLKTYLTGSPAKFKLTLVLISDVFVCLELVRIKGIAGRSVTMVVVKLAASDDEIKVGVMLHPGPITVDEIEKVKIPLQILGADIENVCPPEQVKQFREILSAKPEVDSFVKIFPGVSHGWTVRYKDEDESEIGHAKLVH